MIGQTLAHYRVTAALGEGGMGEVYRATDTKLGRDVAIKVLPAEVAQDAERLTRFEREARLLAALNHPHVAHVYGFERAALADGSSAHFLAMELVEGEDLAERLKRGAIPVDEALEIAVQIAEGLEEAHDKGIVHRDLKPANVKLTPDGKVKVLDFGLARASPVETTSGSAPELSQSPTLAHTGTQAGVILGTAAYMSPEQARGRTVDKRSDIWAFGCLVSEMLTGRRTFGGDSVTDVLASVVKDRPDLDGLPPETPWRIRELLARCLVKDPHERLHDIGDARLEIRAARAHPEPSRVEGGGARGVGRRAAPWVGIGALGGALVASLVWWAAIPASGSGRGPGLARFTIQAEPGFRVTRVSISPDGQTVAYRGVQRPGAPDPEAQLLVRPLSASRAWAVEGSEGVDSFTFSPDGEWIAFTAPLAPQSSRWRILKVATRSGGGTPPVAVADWDPQWRDGLAWLSDGDLLVTTAATPQSFVRVPTDGRPLATAVPLEAEGDGSFWFSGGLPDGQALGQRNTWDGGYRTDPVLLDPATGRVSVIVEDGAHSRLLPSGHLVFSRHDSLLAAPFDAATGRLASAPVAVAGGLSSDAYSFQAFFDLSRNGTLVHLPGGEFGNERRLALLDGTGAQPWSGDHRRFVGEPSVSSDGRWLALTLMNEAGLFEVWGSEVARPALRRLVAFPTLDCTSPVWSADASLLIAGCSGASEADGLYLLEMNGTGDPRPVLRRSPGDPIVVPLSVAPDTSGLLAARNGEKGSELLSVPLAPDAGEPRLILSGQGFIGAAQVSADGSRLAYTSNESGRWELLLRRRGEDGSLGPPVPVAAVGGMTRWRRAPDGRERLYYVTREEQLVSVEAGRDLTLSATTRRLDLSRHATRLGIDVLPDGRVLATLRGEDERPPESINVVLGFSSEVERLVEQPE